ncbi:MAG: methionine adenosyltransferase [Chloroflexi bacterium]|nr:methionine adenosyltransferase [Chloroflexota bacterium]MXX49851.1 methionine adenosyltransferase [Chloroflexota bacterium]MXX82640.1 methionine adenosyltransferase [Chloroflexota bacterium]MYA92656.1 methionine adenosyltransferase [Chloroflexota bacterium]MYC55122.1 methionine adenosyltransferase [Chloroflexota bacterium]
MTSPQYFFTSESVSEGHPDKICDQISDAVLDAILTQDPLARVACEAATTTGLIIVIGEITTRAYVDIESVARQTLADIGYTSANYGFDAQTCGVLISVHEQSPDIKAGVDTALEDRGDALRQDELENTGAGDQGMMIGFACDETPELMPLTASLSHRVMRRLAAARKAGEMPWLRPDSKCQITVEYAHGQPQRVDTIVVSTQHAPDITQAEIRRQIIDFIQRDAECARWIDADTIYHINPTGRFVTGGPMGDAGLTGRKIVVDTYGGVARHGGGAFSGKDATKVDRSAAYMARYVAKNVVAAGLARRFELQVSYAIGKAEPTSLAVETFGTATVSDARIEDLIRQHFDMRPAAIIRQLGLRQPIFKQVAAYGHFGREDVEVPWERTDKADLLRDMAQLD